MVIAGPVSVYIETYTHGFYGFELVRELDWPSRIVIPVPIR